MTCPVCLLWKFQHFPPALILPLNIGLEWAGLTCYSSKSEDYGSVADQMSKWQDQPVTGNLHESSCSPWILQRRCFLSAKTLRRAAPSRCLCSSEQDPAQGKKQEVLSALPGPENPLNSYVSSSWKANLWTPLDLPFLHVRHVRVGFKEWPDMQNPGKTGGYSGT